MPTSKTRKKPASAPRRSDSPRPPATLETATLAMVQASFEVVREAEVAIQAAARHGDREEVDKALEVHHHLRSGALGLLVAYSQLAGLPDPRESAVVS